IMHASYRQNFGFTDIVIGRKHADAPYDDGKDIWDGLAAQRKFDELKGELRIRPVKVGFAAYYEELGRVGLVDEYGPRGYKQVNISGREMREKLRAGVLPDPRVMRPETARGLIASRKGKQAGAPGGASPGPVGRGLAPPARRVWLRAFSPYPSCQPDGRSRPADSSGIFSRFGAIIRPHLGGVFSPSLVLLGRAP